MTRPKSECGSCSSQAALPRAKDKLLFTPGPLTTSLSVKKAMLHDAGSWHSEFNSLVADMRERLLKLAGVSRENGWETVLLQGSGTFGVEAVFQTCVPPEGKVAVLANGAYGERIVQMLTTTSGWPTSWSACLSGGWIWSRNARCGIPIFVKTSRRRTSPSMRAEEKALLLEVSEACHSIEQRCAGCGTPHLRSAVRCCECCRW